MQQEKRQQKMVSHDEAQNIARIFARDWVGAWKVQRYSWVDGQIKGLFKMWEMIAGLKGGRVHELLEKGYYVIMIDYVKQGCRL